MNVLVVDDDYISRTAVARTLEKGGYQVTTANDGQMALDLFHQHHFQMVVTDWEMPRISGIELCKAIRKLSPRRYIYCIIVTARDRAADTAAGFAGGTDDYITKPFNPHELLMRVGVGRRIVQLESANMTIFALAKLAESRDPETGAHLERVQRYCRILAEHLQRNPRFADKVNDDYVDLICRTSPLHDIGKVSIPDNILLKPGRLTKEEFDVMKTHTVRGAETIESLLHEFPNTCFLKMALNIIISHHEKWDGSGYPHGLVGQQIPLCGRIMAIADVYDALTSKRVYKEAFSHERAKSIIVGDSGTHFDPDMVDAFVAMEEEFVTIASRFAEPLSPNVTPQTDLSPVPTPTSGTIENATIAPIASTPPSLEPA
ncbi:Cyclic di-GMP phosphodiesterase response regulator RpfG [Rosistilla carotiformis]|uniref:Cyclic di-GMP phosphodiesterase response regulator RpfG n=1 Tax=Rosistilla carotiformis TaxID=2528017 RepID=A0A518K1A5_9BACT|nr:HD domain-containing phosphohydrolase [Rosistilla carotiformis]QDV71580.1 Cyclic di-GMP phosphodiesterase response regulator RpfG [Rosistilla carotiformis]